MTKLELTEYQETMLKRQVSETTYFNNGKTTVAIITMKNGFEIVGTSSCVHRENFDMAMGRHYALVDALRQMDGYIGFGRQQEAYEQEQYLKEQAEIELELKKIREENHASLGFNGEGIKTFEAKPNWHGKSVVVNTADLGRISHLPLESTVFNEPMPAKEVAQEIVDAINNSPYQSEPRAIPASSLNGLVTLSNLLFNGNHYVD